MKFFLSYLFWVFWATFINAQNIFYDQLNTESGLPSSTVFDIFQDSKRFIWLATEEGLIKYNGVDFKTYSHPDLHSKSGSNIKEDVLGRVWYQTFDGYLYYVNSKDELETFSQTNNIGFVNFGTFDISPTCILWPFLWLMVQITAVFTFRALVFGG